jgi:hypothetical protein
MYETKIHKTMAIYHEVMSHHIFVFCSREAERSPRSIDENYILRLICESTIQSAF